MNTVQVDFPTADMRGSASEHRHDARQRDIVASGIGMLQQVGVVPVVEYFKRHAVGAQVIERVLLYPERRRAAL